MIQARKQIITLHGGRHILAVSLNHETTEIYGMATRPVEECPVDVLTAVKGTDWSDPLLQEMRQECLWEMQKKAHATTELLELLDSLLEVPPEVLGLQPLFPTEQSA